MPAPELSPPVNECDIDSGKITTSMEEFDQLFGKITGQSGEYNLITEPVGNDFSGLVGDNLRSAANENREAWESSLSACLLAYGVLSEVNDAVVEYDDAIEDIRNRYNSYVNSVGDVLPDNFRIVLQSYHNEATGAKASLQSGCNSAEDKLSDGPTPETMRALTEAGHFGDDSQIGYAVTSDLDYYVFSEDDAVTAANSIKESTVNGYDGGLGFQLALVNALILRGIDAQENGKKLSKNELDFIDAFFNELEIEEGQAAQGRGDSTPQEFLNFFHSVNGSEHLDEETKAAINESLAGVTLLASDEKIGGGVGHLPQDVYDAAAGVSTTYDDIELLSDLLSHSNKEVEGGVDFSATMATTVANIIEQGGLNEQVFSEEAAEGILDVASRNEEANYVLLSGEYPNGSDFKHHPNNSDMTPEDIMAALYTHDWDDDGEAVAGITEWIIPSSDGDAGEDLRDKGLDALVALFEDEAFSERMAGTGESVQESVQSDSDSPVAGEQGDLWLDVSAGHLNPELAGAFGDIFIAHMDEFSNSNGVSSSDDREVRFTPESALAFTQVPMGNEDAAQEVYSNVLVNSAEVMEDFLRNMEDWDHTDSSAAGSLQGLVERALLNESSNRVENHNDQADFYNKISSGIVDVIGGMDLGVSGPTMEIAKIIANESLEIEKVDEGQEENKARLMLEETYERDEKLQGTAVAVYAEEGKEREALIELMEERYKDAIYEEDGEKRVKWDHRLWGVGENSDGALANIFSEIASENVKETVSGDNSLGDEVGTYGETFDGARVRWNEVGLDIESENED